MQIDKPRRSPEHRGRKWPLLLAALLLAGAALPGSGLTRALALSEIGAEAAEEPGSFDGLRDIPTDFGPDEPLPEVIYNLDRLPEPVRRMHGLITEAARSGDIEKLRPLLGGTQLSFGGVEGDPIEFLKGDSEGHEILAILEEVLDAGYVHLGAGTPDELYVWPYFYVVPPDRLTDPQLVELFKIITAGDFEEMEAFGSYIFYRAGFHPDGNWAFFVAGD